METAMKPVQDGRSRKRRWPAEQKLAVLQEWKNGVPLEEVCRKYALNAAQMYRWKRSLEQGLKESGEMVPKGQKKKGDVKLFCGFRSRSLGGNGISHYWTGKQCQRDSKTLNGLEKTLTSNPSVATHGIRA